VKISRWLLLLLSGFLLLSGCQVKRNSDYFPLKVGNSWEYSLDFGASLVLTIPSTENIDGHECFLADFVVKNWSPGCQRDEYFLTKEGLFLARRIMQQGQTTISFNPPQKLLDNTLKPGASWKWSGEIRTLGPRGSEEQKGDLLTEVVGFEKIKALKKTFDCCKIKVSGTVSPGVRLEELKWYCDGVGLVKNQATLTVEGRRQVTNVLLTGYSLK